ncbi:hypothetical protein BpHYR1_013267 [Brachionus plicatilis]|uniref:Uncharacterized protein n=1 Tax=Brachionus plicatilis TaxID=10195 RepID=A0A3M7SQF8_BRAPC|nr:hypothetical protein BpHYR1_013267 [Brachionus plicatilis]
MVVLAALIQLVVQRLFHRENILGRLRQKARQSVRISLDQIGLDAHLLQSLAQHVSKRGRVLVVRLLVKLVHKVDEHVIGLVGQRGRQQIWRASTRLLKSLASSLKLKPVTWPVWREADAWLSKNGTQTELTAFQSGSLLALVVLDLLSIIAGQLNVQSAHRLRAGGRVQLGQGGARVLQKDESAIDRTLFGVLDANGDGRDVAAHFEPLHPVVQHFHLLALGHHHKGLSLLERFLLFVVGDAVDAELGLGVLVPLGVHHESGHEGHGNGLAIQLGGHFGRLGHILTVHEPEAGRHGRGERHALVYVGEGRMAGDVLPLGGRQAARDATQQA